MTDHGSDGRRKVLLVDDSALVLRIASAYLSESYDVVTSSSGEEALDKALAERPDLILMDLSLPVIDGWEATRRLKAASETRHIPVIALTAHAMTGDREKAVEAGCDDFDTKPVDLARLLGKIYALLPQATGA